MNVSSVLCSIASVVLILIGILVMWKGCLNLWHDYNSPEWPSVPGTIQTSRVEEFLTGTDSSTHRSRMFSASIVFGYNVNGRNLTSDTVFIGGAAGSEDSSEAEVLHLRYPQGAAVKVFHDPDDPSIAVLEPGMNSDVFWLPGIGLALLLPGIIFWVARWMYGVEQGWVNLSGNLIAGGLFLAGAAMLVTGIKELRVGMESRQWPTADGVMISSPQKPENFSIQDQEKREAERKAAGGVSDSTGLVYGYEVDGRKYFATAYRFGALSLKNYVNDPEFGRRYAFNTPVKVAYSRDNPSLAVLEPGVFPDACWIPGIGVFLLLAGLAIALFAVPLLAGIKPTAIDPEAQEWMRRMREQSGK